MKKRIGNDISFVWHIYRKSGETQVPESFTGKEVEVRLISPLQRPVTIEDVSIATGVVTFTFKGKNQVTLGNYVAVLLENKGEDGMVTLDVVDAVTLVPHSYMEEDGDEGDVIEASSVELESSISAGSGGGIEQQQADWAQTDDTAVDFIKNKPDLNLFAKLDVSNEHEQNTSDTYKQLYGGEQELRRTSIGGGGLLLRVGRLQPVWFEYEDAKKLKDLPTDAELSEVATSGSYNDLSDKPDLSAFITKSVNDLTNYYLKSETYTKNEVLQLIGAIQQFHYEVYPTLPQTGASNVLYLIGPTGTGADKYEEYVYANDTFTKIGDTSIDLSGYVTTQALNTALADYVTSSALSTALANYYNKNDVDGLLAGKADSADLASVATSGSYNDLSDTPTIPVITGKADKVSNATNGNFAALDSNGNLIDSGHKHSDYLTQHQDLSNYVQKSQTTGLLKNDGTVDTTQYLSQHQDISGKEDITPIEAVASGTTAITAQVNKYYEVAGTVSSLTVTLPTPTANTEVTMVVVHLTVGASPMVVVTSVNEVVKFSAAYSVVANKEYELSCLYNGSKWIVSSMEVAV